MQQEVINKLLQQVMLIYAWHHCRKYSPMGV